jgi:hypothetical protein
VINYHFLGFIKKILLVLVIFVVRDGDLNKKFIMIYCILGVWMILGVIACPFNNKLLNFMRILSDLIVIGILVNI